MAEQTGWDMTERELRAEHALNAYRERRRLRRGEDTWFGDGEGLVEVAEQGLDADDLSRRRLDVIQDAVDVGMGDELAEMLYDVAREEGLDPVLAFELVRCGMGVLPPSDGMENAPVFATTDKYRPGVAGAAGGPRHPAARAYAALQLPAAARAAGAAHGQRGGGVPRLCPRARRGAGGLLTPAGLPSFPFRFPEHDRRSRRNPGTRPRSPTLGLDPRSCRAGGAGLRRAHAHPGARHPPAAGRPRRDRPRGHGHGQDGRVRPAAGAAHRQPRAPRAGAGDGPHPRAGRAGGRGHAQVRAAAGRARACRLRRPGHQPAAARAAARGARDRRHAGAPAGPHPARLAGPLGHQLRGAGRGRRDAGHGLHRRHRSHHRRAARRAADGAVRATFPPRIAGPGAQGAQGPGARRRHAGKAGRAARAPGGVPGEPRAQAGGAGPHPGRGVAHQRHHLLPHAHGGGRADGGAGRARATTPRRCTAAWRRRSATG